MKYADLLRHLLTLSIDELNQTATVYHAGMDEFYPIEKFSYSAEDDVLDKGHPYMECDINKD